MSSGSGDKSRIYRTTDGSAHWAVLFTNPDAKGFFDGIAFWDARRGIVVGDPVEGHITVFTTSDAGEHWIRRQTPPAIANEGAFAASNSALALWGTPSGRSEAWFGAGGPGAARVFHSKHGGVTWTVAWTPLRNDTASAGIFSIAFRDAKHGTAVGGVYLPARQMWIATGTSGADSSADGATWRQ